MKARYFHHQPRRGVTAIGPIAHAVEDDDQIETWMIGQGQSRVVVIYSQPGGNGRTSDRDAGAATSLSLQ